MTPAEETLAYQIVLGRNPEAGAKLGQRTGYQFIVAAQKELADQRAARAKQLSDLQVALANEKNKPPQTVIKEVEKIVEKVVEVEKPVDEKAVVTGFFKRIWDNLFKK